MNARWEELLVQATTRDLSVGEVLEFNGMGDAFDLEDVVAIIEERLCSVTFDMHVVERVDNCIIAGNDWNTRERDVLRRLGEDEVGGFVNSKVLVNGTLYGIEMTYHVDEGMTARQEARDARKVQ